tara:strand:+ start:839 stop:2725 length:1887 start_codon:yes stop_codon:yes gene_type:complete
MADNLASFKVFCQGGLNTSRDVLSQGENQPGSATALINYEPAVTGGYRKISGFANNYGTVTGTGSVLGVCVANGINDGILACRTPSSGSNYLHKYINSSTSWGEITCDVIANDRDGVCASQTPSGSGNLTINGALASSGSVNFTTAASEQPRQVTFFGTGDESGKTFTITGTDFLGAAQTEEVTGPNNTTVSSTKYFNTITQIAVSAGTAAAIEVGSGTGLFRTSNPTMSGVTKVRFTKYNFGSPKVILTDGINPAAIYDGTTYRQILDSIAPTDPKFSAIFKNHLFLAGDPAEDTNLYFSAPLAETDFSAANGSGVINVGFPIVAIKPFRDALYIFGSNNIRKLVGNNIANFVLETVTDDLGCLATDSVIEIGGDLLFLSQDGLRPVSGTDKIGDVNLETVSKDIQSIFTDIVFDIDLDTLNAVVIRQKTQFRYFFGAADSQGVIGGFRQTPNGLQFEYSQMLGITATCADSGYIGQNEFVLHGDSSGKVHRQEQGNSFSGTEIFSLFQTPFFHMQDPEQRKVFYSVATYMRSEGDNELVMSAVYDYDDVDVLSPSNFTLTTTGAAAYYNEATYNATAIFDGNPSPVQRTNIAGSGKSASFRFVTNDTNASHSIQGLVITFGVGDRL